MPFDKITGTTATFSLPGYTGLVTEPDLDRIVSDVEVLEDSLPTPESASDKTNIT